MPLGLQFERPDPSLCTPFVLICLVCYKGDLGLAPHAGGQRQSTAMENSVAGYRRGAVVQLRSGGPMMTIHRIETNIDDERVARCYWFDRLQATWSTFALHMLEVVEEKEGDTIGAVVPDR